MMKLFYSFILLLLSVSPVRAMEYVNGEPQGGGASIGSYEDVVGLWTDCGSLFMKGDGTCSAGSIVELDPTVDTSEKIQAKIGLGVYQTPLSAGTDYLAPTGDGSRLSGVVTSETDPAFAAWDRSTGITITSSQITDITTYLTYADITALWTDCTAGVLMADGTCVVLGSAASSATTDFEPAGAAAAVIASSISDSDTTHCPDGNSVFDALAGKQASGSYLTSASIDTSAEFYGILGDETGSASGTPLAVFNQHPTIAAPVITGLASNTPQSIVVTTEGDITLTSTVGLISGDNDEDNDIIDLQNGTYSGQSLLLCSISGVDSTDTITVAMTDTTCTGCGTVKFTDVGQCFRLTWSGSTWMTDSEGIKDRLTFTADGFPAYDYDTGFVDNYFDLANFELTSKTWGIKANGIASSEIATIVESIVWNAAGTTSDGTQCADPAKVTINSGPITYTTKCADNDASTIYGHVVMPDSWDGGTVTMESEYIQTAADTNALNGDIACMCRGAGETVNNTWGSEVAIDDAAVSGSNIVDHTTSAAMTCNGTCAGGDTLYWRYQMDATGTTTAVATLHFVGWKMEYTSNVGD